MAERLNFEKILEGSDSPTLLYIAMVITIGFFLGVVVYALFI
jgi:hypothetical protein